MSTLKTVTITTAVVIVITSAPFIWQKSKAGKLERDLADLELQRLALTGQVEALGARNASGSRNVLGSAATPVRTARDLLLASEGPIDVDTLLRSMVEVMATQDIVGMIRVLLPISNLDLAEYDSLVRSVEQHSGHGQTKQMALQMLGSFAPSGNPQEAIERVMKIGLEPHAYGDLLARWGSQDPDAALAWYRQKESAGAFLSKGVNDPYEGILLAELVGGIAAKNPRQALDLFKEGRDSDKNNRMLATIGRGYGKWLRDSDDDALLRELIGVASPSGDDQQKVEIVRAAASAAVPAGDLDAQFAFVSQYLEDPEARLRAAVSFARDSENRPVAERGDWLLENTPANLQAQAIGELISSATFQNSESASEWVLRQSGEVRDSGLRSIFDRHVIHGQHQLALEHAEQIADDSIKTEALESLARRWVARDPEEASSALPAELVEKYRTTHEVTTPAATRTLETKTSD